ncbi:MAG: hypothetical protein JO187_05120 [Acidobacteria bacterium]|nr:hypothetical protein [Acidobacteriota bacterium]
MFALFTLVYLTHLIGFAITGLIVLVYTLAEKLQWRRRLRCWAAFIPSGFLYATSHMSITHGDPASFRSLPQKFFAARAALLHGYSMAFEIILFWVIVACVLAGYVRNPEFRWNRSWLIVFIALSVVYLALPVSAGTAWAIDVRLVPMIFVVTLAVAKIGRRQKAVAAIGVIAAAAWIGNVCRNFILLQDDLAPMHSAIQMLPRNARMLPIVDIDLSDDHLHRLYEHFWAYAVIERGALAPYIFDLPGQTEVRVRQDGFVPDMPEETPPNWLEVRRNYDYVWLWDIDYAAQLSNHGTEVYHSEKLQLWRMKPVAGQ